ncbi:hypothetical protein RAAC3_TM7C00001G0941 [Candidatus Saccharibacteria bacterium RAAC3_TM7_1]|nr:hypothetical protein RAAC3_TM7C00001G0941 [Candidatus Saccharibacteria bacterium RAAC3_TM7_1]
MKDVLDKTPNKLRTSTVAIVAVMSGIALNSCTAADKGTAPTPACAIHIERGDTLYSIAAASDMDIREGIAEMKQINSGVDAGHLSIGDDVAISSQMCQDIIGNKKNTLDLRPLHDDLNQ